jgi:hypothetical protein
MHQDNLRIDFADAIHTGFSNRDRVQTALIRRCRLQKEQEQEHE